MSSNRYQNIRECCPAHPEANLIDDHINGCMVCPECGLVVVDQVISECEEWRTFADDNASEERNRVGGQANYFLSDYANLATNISAHPRTYNQFGQAVLHYANRRSVSGIDRALTAAFRTIATIADRLHLPQSVVNQANYLYQRSYKKFELKGNVMFRDAKSAACVYLACNYDKCPRTSKEVCGVSDISQREVIHSAKRIATALQLPKTSRNCPTDYLSRFCANLGLPRDVVRAAAELARDSEAYTKEYDGEEIAASVIYLATEHHPLNERSLEKISETTGVDVEIMQTMLSVIRKLFSKI